MTEQARFTHHSDGIVYEPARDLYWTANDAAADRVDFDGANTAVAALNEQSFGGFTDWRLPTIEELFLLADRTRFNPAIDTDFFPTCSSEWYWTGTLDAEDPDDYAWFVGFHHGHSNHGHRVNLRRVRAVRGPARQ